MSWANVGPGPKWVQVWLWLCDFVAAAVAVSLAVAVENLDPMGQICLVCLTYPLAKGG